MYIRRKVFSVYTDEYGEERYFSTNEIMNEEDYLDELMYSDDESHVGRNIAIGAGALGATGAGLYGAARWGNKRPVESEYLAKRGEKAAKTIEGLSEKQLKKKLTAAGRSIEGLSEAQMKAAYREILDNKAKESYNKAVNRRVKAGKPWGWLKGKGDQAVNWAKANPKTAALAGIGAAGAAGAGMYYAGRHDQKSRRR